MDFMLNLLFQHSNNCARYPGDPYELHTYVMDFLSKFIGVLEKQNYHEVHLKRLALGKFDCRLRLIKINLYSHWFWQNLSVQRQLGDSEFVISKCSIARTSKFNVGWIGFLNFLKSPSSNLKDQLSTGRLNLWLPMSLLSDGVSKFVIYKANDYHRRSKKSKQFSSSRLVFTSFFKI